MELKKILIGLDGLKVKGDLSIDIKKIESDSSKVNEDTLFVAIKGFESDGHDYILEAIEKGATAVMAQMDIDRKILKQIPEGVTIVIAEDTRHALAISAANFYENPSKKFRLIGITGTKGKTTTAFMMKKILEKDGKKVGLIGTIGSFIGEEKIDENDRTTPESLELQKIFKKMKKAGCEVVIMEVSSQSLKLHRVDGCDFNIAVFTNLSEDHISKNEHPDIEDYFKSKLKLIEMARTSYVNADDLYVAKIPSMFKENENKEIYTFGTDNFCNILGKDITITNTYADFKMKLGQKNDRIKVFIPGRFTVYNALAAISVCLKIGCDTEKIKEALLEVKVPGRSEMVDNKKDLKLMIDYAHTPESLKSIIETAKMYTKGRVIVLFGCGGDRDSSKREIMGEIAGNLADLSIITSDNPRTEKPEEIISQIEEGIKKTSGKYEVMVDRLEAMKYALKIARKDDLIIFAGKGHETYQIIGKTKKSFDERVIIKDILDGKI